jgi:hypothetical protein
MSSSSTKAEERNGKCHRIGISITLTTLLEVCEDAASQCLLDAFVCIGRIRWNGHRQALNAAGTGAGGKLSSGNHSAVPEPAALLSIVVGVAMLLLKWPENRFGG